MSELSDGRETLNLARSRFEAALLNWHLAQMDRDEAYQREREAWHEMCRLADEQAAAARRVLHEQTIAGE